MLKVLDGSFAPMLLDFFTRNQDFLKPWESIKENGFYSLDFQREQLTNELQKMGDDRLFKVWLFEKADTGFDKPIGSVALNEIVRGCFHSCFLGYRMDEYKRNQGYMTEAVGAVIDYGFNKLALHRIEANIMPHNKASLRVVDKSEFSNWFPTTVPTATFRIFSFEGPETSSSSKPAVVLLQVTLYRTDEILTKSLSKTSTPLTSAKPVH